MSRVEFIKVLKIMGNDVRLNILEMLSSPEKYFPDAQGDVKKQGVCAGLIAKKSGFSQSTVSGYMSKLEDVSLVCSKRQGQWTFYRLNPKKLSEMVQMVTKLKKGEML